jgi:hypothetical protein
VLPNQTGNSPFNVGVSGHRDLSPADLPRLRGLVAEFFTELGRHLPNTELRIILGMAEGADLLVAEAALDLGLMVEAVLPMPLEQYGEDFGPQDLARLDNLLARPQVRHTVLSPPPHPHLHLHPHGHAPAGGQARDPLYENLTHTLIRRSSLLLALWDGKPSHLRGGTADTVLRYLGVRTDGEHEDVVLSFVDAAGGMDATERLVYWVPAGRAGDAFEGTPPAACYLRGVGDNSLETQRTMPAAMTQQLVTLDHYNKEYVDLRAARRIGAPDSLLSSLPADAPLSDDMMLADIDLQYGKADSLAIHYQIRSDRLFLLLSAITFTMGATLLIYEHISESRILLAGYMLILLTSVAVFRALRHRHWFTKHLTYRAIAETMRAKFFLRLAGIDHRVDAGEVLGLWGIDRFQGFGWIGYVLKGVESPDVHVVVSPEDHARRSRCVEQSWIDSQYRYFTAKVGTLEKRSRRVKRLASTVFVVILVVMASLIGFGESMPEDIGLGLRMREVLTFIMEFLAVLLAVWRIHQEKMATRELLWQYRNQMNHFSRAQRKLACMTSQRRRNEVLVELGKDSLMESYLWTIHRYHREHEPPSSG